MCLPVILARCQVRISLGIYVCTQFDPWLGQPGVKPADSCGGSAGPQRSAKIFQQWCSAERDREPCGVVGPICPTATEGAAGREEGRCRPHLQSSAPGTPQGDHGLHHSAQPQVFLRVPLPMSALPTPVSPSFNVVVRTTLFWAFWSCSSWNPSNVASGWEWDLPPAGWSSLAVGW